MDMLDYHLNKKAIENQKLLNKLLSISPDQLRKALKDIEIAESNGFNCCSAVFQITTTGAMLENIQADYVDIFERAYSNNGHLNNWGRDNYLSKKYKVEDGKLILLKEKEEKEVEW